MRDNHVAISAGENEIQFVLACAMCHETFTYLVPFEQYMCWRAGELVQRVFPDLPREHREMFISGTCNSCFHRLFDGMQSKDQQCERDADA